MKRQQALTNIQLRDSLVKRFKGAKRTEHHDYESNKTQEQPVIDAIENLGTKLEKLVETSNPQLPVFNSLSLTNTQEAQPKSLTDVLNPNEYKTLIGAKLLHYLNNCNDKIFGMRPYGSRRYIGNSEVKFDHDDLIIEGKRYTGTDGLLKLMTRTDVNLEDVSDEDYKEYEEILRVSNAIYKKNDPTIGLPKSSKSQKYKTFISPIWKKLKTGGGGSIRKSDVVKTYTEFPKKFSWIKDFRQVIDRLLVIVGEENAGNDNYQHEKEQIMKAFCSRLTSFVMNEPKGLEYLIKFMHCLPRKFWISEREGKGFINDIINCLPFELHLPGYNYLGPGTRLEERLERGDRGINPLDEAAKQHDIAYHENKDVHSRHIADKVLEKVAMQRVVSSNASLDERLAALGTATTMRMKVKLGMGF